MIKYTYKITVKGRDLKGTVGSLNRFPYFNKIDLKILIKI